MVVIEMNPRVSRSSALASKATGFPIAKVAAKLAVGYTLDEIANDITGGATPASFEPTIDYIVTKVPRFAFEKFPGAEPMLTTAMKSVGEAMAIGRTFAESLQKALRSLETGLTGLDEIEIEGIGLEDDKKILRAALGQPTPDRLLVVAQALRHGMSLDEIYDACKIDRWFLARIKEIVDLEEKVRAFGLPEDADNLRMLKAAGFSDTRLATLAGTDEASVRALRHAARRAPAVQADRYLRRRIRLAHSLYVFDLRSTLRRRSRRRGAALDAGEDRHPRRRPEPHRPGHRIRLLLLPCQFRAARGGL